MYNQDDFLKLIKQTAMEAMEASQPSNILFGTVLSVSPLKVQVDSKMLLLPSQIGLSRNVTDHWIEMTVEHSTEPASGGSDDEAFAEHSHLYKGRKRFLVHNGLLAGERVVLAKCAGGQKYIILDRIAKE